MSAPETSTTLKIDFIGVSLDYARLVASCRGPSDPPTGSRQDSNTFIDYSIAVGAHSTGRTFRSALLSYRRGALGGAVRRQDYCQVEPIQEALSESWDVV